MNDLENDLEFIFEEKNTKNTSSKRAYIRMHETKNGTLLPIMAMTDSHIISTIKLFLRIAIETKKNVLYNINDNLDMFHNELNGFKPITKDEALHRISNIMYKLEPYITELVIRGNFNELQKINSDLSELLGRKKNLTYHKEVKNELII